LVSSERSKHVRWAKARSAVPTRRKCMGGAQRKARAALAAASQLSGDLQAMGPRLTRREAVGAICRGPIALVEDVLDIELRLPGLGDLRAGAGVVFRVAKAALVMNDLVGHPFKSSSW
jgi:hypothetical protein